jgi:CHAT domain
MPTVLILAASPNDQDRLLLSREVKKIRQALERSRNRENWRIESNEAATVEDLRRALLDHQPTVVHFSGHGGGDAGLCFEDDQGGTHLTHAAPLAKLFHHFKDRLKCVVLNACYSRVQADVIRQQVDYVIGMQSGIGDEAATKFAVAFYDGLFAGTDFRVGFDLACTAIDLHNLPDTKVPVLLTAPHLGGADLAYTESVPEIETVLHAYMNTPHADRHRFTTRGDALADAMRQYYGDAMLATVSQVTVISKRQIDRRHWKVHARVEIAGDRSFRNYYVQVEGRAVLVDWEATVGYWSKPVKTYLALGTRETVTARVTAELGTYYNYYFADKERHFQNIELRTVDNKCLYGYVARFNPVYKELMQILSDGNSHELTLGIRNIDDDTDLPLIETLLSRSWVYPEEGNNCPHQ